MSITLELTSAEEEALLQGARKRGMDLPTFLKTSALERVHQEADDWVRWQAAGEIAAAEACDELIAKGIGYVYGRDGVVYRRQPDGTEERITTASE